jgi:hypothetical protein
MDVVHNLQASINASNIDISHLLQCVNVLACTLLPLPLLLFYQSP